MCVGKFGFAVPQAAWILAVLAGREPCETRTDWVRAVLLLDLPPGPALPRFHSFVLLIPMEFGL